MKPEAILLTHAHFDHIGGVEDIRNHYNIPVSVHKKEAEWLMDPVLNGSSLFPVTEIAVRPADHFLTVGNGESPSFRFEIRHTPGHSPGSVSFVFHEENIVVGGDALFQQGIGRTDLPGGNSQILKDSISRELFSLDDSYVVYPGHGPETTIGREKSTNPFF